MDIRSFLITFLILLCCQDALAKNDGESEENSDSMSDDKVIDETIKSKLTRKHHHCHTTPSTLITGQGRAVLAKKSKGKLSGIKKQNVPRGTKKPKKPLPGNKKQQKATTVRRRKNTKVPKKKTQRIVGGDPAVPYMFKSIVAVKSEGQTRCGGTLVRPNWVITAAHCIVPNDDPTKFAITAGEYDRGKHEGFEQERNISQVIRHTGYDRETDENDIALLKLDKPVIQSDKIQTVILPSKNFKPNVNVVVAGWGVLEPKSMLGSPTLMTVNLPILTVDECREKYEDYVVNEKQICTLARGGGKDACQGDSGGPLYSIDANGAQTLVGVVSWGVSCAHEDNPGVYTKVSAYMDWIIGYIGPENKQPPLPPVKPPSLPPVKPPPVPPVKPPPVHTNPVNPPSMSGLFTDSNGLVWKLPKPPIFIPPWG